MWVMNDYAILYRLNAEKIKAIKDTTVYYVIASDNDIYYALVECKYRNIKLRKITPEQYYIITTPLNGYPKQIIEYFLINGVDKTKELLYYNNKKREITNKTWWLHLTKGLVGIIKHIKTKQKENKI